LVGCSGGAAIGALTRGQRGSGGEGSEQQRGGRARGARGPSTSSGAEPGPQRRGERLLQLLALCTRCVAWRTTAGAAASRITSAQVQAAELFEDTLQQPRLNLLRRLFPAATEVAFVPAHRSPQNRCLLAGPEEALQRCCSAASEAEMLAALRRARDELVALVGGPLDLKPKGFVSKKYAYDGT